MRRHTKLVLCATVLLVSVGCRENFVADDESSSGDGESESGGDGDGDGECGEEENCSPGPEGGWQGLVVLWTGESDPPPCPSEFPTTIHPQLNDDLTATESQCGCFCEDAVGLSCGSVEVTEADEKCIDLDPGQAWELEDGDCISVGTSATNFNASEPVVSTEGASCPAVAMNEIPDPVWTDSARTCARTDNVCDGDGQCIPSLDSEYDRLCMWIEGEVDCPDGNFPVQRILYSDYDDARGCTECTCGPIDAACDFTVLARDECGAGDVTGQLAEPGCQQLDNPIGVFETTIHPDGFCEPALTEPTGGLTPNGAITFCCQNMG